MGPVTNPSPEAEDGRLERLRRFLSSHADVRLAVVFGSFARGRESARSDVDLLLRRDPDDEATRWRLEVEAARAAGRHVDVVYSAEAPPLLRFEIARAGRVLVERVPGDWVRFKVRAMVDWYDWAPIARRMHAAGIARLREEVAAGRP